MTTPEGKRVVFLANGNIAVAVSVGQEYADGYMVESITSDAVTLLYAPMNARVEVPIPASPAR